MSKNRKEIGGQMDFDGTETEVRPVLVRIEGPDEDGNFWVISLRDETSRIKFGLAPDKTKPFPIMEEGFLQPLERQQAFEFAAGVLLEAEETGRFKPKQQTPLQKNQTEFPI